MDRKFRESPGSEYRALAFWSLNGELEENELFRQLLEFKLGGFGGVFLHARGTPKTPYMTNMWMEKMRFCMQTAADLGLEAWIYDEVNWPSGRAEGTVERLGGRNSAKKLSAVAADCELPMAGELGRSEDGKLAFCVGYGSGTNQLNAQTTQDFIDIVYERYKKDCGEFFGKACPGAFFDEPQYASAYDNNDYVPWGEELPAVYRELWGEDIIPNLESLFFDRGDYRRVRKQFWAALAELYARSWGLPLYRWCEKNGLKLTGHYEWEEDFKHQIRCTSDIMRHYEYEHIPGTDHLGYGLYAPWIHLQCSSVSQQLGKERTMCECFGVGGQGVTVEDRRWMYGQLLSRGVDMFVPHISHYSLEGDNKRDCPPYNQYQQPWWHYGAAVEEGVSKANRIVSAGHDRVSICILDPIVSAWSGYRPGDTEYIDRLQEDYEALHGALADAGVSFHYIGESYFKKYASVENGKLKMGRMVYDTVILPGVSEMMDLTAKTLDDFAAQGGRIFALGTSVPGARDITLEELSALLSAEKGFETDGPCWVRTFELEGKLCRLFDNPKKNLPVCITVGGNRNLRFIDTFTGVECIKAPGEKYTVAPASFVIGEETDAAPFALPELPVKDSIEVTGSWIVDPRLHLRDEKNCVTLDVCSLWVEGEGVVASGYTGDVRGIAAAERAKRVSAQWRKDHGNADFNVQDNMQYRVSFKFRAETVPEKLSVAAELGEQCRVCLNGRELKARNGYFLDSSFVCFDGTDAVKPGENEIVLCAVTGRHRPVVEDVFLLGDFSCRIENTDQRVIDAPVLSIDSPRCPEEQGFPFFAGELCIKNTFSLPSGVCCGKLRLENVSASAVAVLVNGEAAEPLVGAPWERDISRLIRPGENKLELRLVGTLRNLLGPIHNTTAELRSVGPGDYNDKSRWCDAPYLRPTGVEKVFVDYGTY
ncbi:MAG: hypothetical protein IJY86_08735 [Clostridia bacterium]|nr:hypothetical protein [Clostridia bacterium]